MLKPEVVGKYSQQLNDITTDLLSQMKTTRDGNGIVPNIQQELFKWSLECELIHVLLCLAIEQLCHSNPGCGYISKNVVVWN